MRETALEPPGPHGWLGSNLWRLRRDRLFFLAGLAVYGDVAFLRLGPQAVYLVSHPDLVKEVLVIQGKSFMKGQALQEAKKLLGEGLLTSEGELHLRQRRLIQPLFHHDRISGYGEVMVECGLRAAGRWRDGETIDAAGEMMRLTLAIVGRTLFDADVEEDAEDVGEALSTAMELLDRFMLPLSGLLQRLPLPGTLRLRAAQQRLDAIVGRMIDERRRDPAGRSDLLSLLLQARDDEDGAGMSSTQIRDEAMTIFLAGHETTAQALTWTWYLLSEHPAVEAALHEELDRVLGGRPPGVGDLPALTTTHAVVSESMRLYPPAWAVGRRALQDVQLGGYVVPAGSIVVMSQYVVHRDPRWWPEPERFDPGRWTDEAEAARPRYAYFPFGGGSRLCIGERFAWMEAILLVATLAQRWRFRLVPGHPVELAPRVTLRPKHGMRMTVERR